MINMYGRKQGQAEGIISQESFLELLKSFGIFLNPSVSDHFVNYYRI